MLKLLLGLFLWWGAHSLKRLAPGMRRDLNSALGEGPSKGIIGMVLLGATVLLVLGYRDMDHIAVYTPLAEGKYLNNILMLFAIFAMGIGPAGGRLCARFRHPMLWGFFLWAVAHLLVTGDLASLLLFGGLGLWVPVQVRLINQHEGPWEPPKPGNALQDAKLALATLFIYAVIAGIHWLFGLKPF